MNLEDDLRRALKRTPAPPDFADRVIARVEKGDEPLRFVPRARRFTPNTSAMQWLAAAAAVVLLAGGGVRYYEYQQNVAEAKRVEAEIRLAMQITGETLALVQTRLNESSR